MEIIDRWVKSDEYHSKREVKRRWRHNFPMQSKVLKKIEHRRMELKGIERQKTEHENDTARLKKKGVEMGNEKNTVPVLIEDLISKVSCCEEKHDTTPTIDEVTHGLRTALFFWKTDQKLARQVLGKFIENVRCILHSKDPALTSLIDLLKEKQKMRQ